ncbi:ATPase [Empedobacter sp. UBA5987]|uniref:ATPase n=1 Tax=Empedobacter sp. UBA5987 TaxID=1946444 RepID=UPI0025BA4F1A|nr:ATPase [Empedobacter sp. UBA5987]
MINYQKLLFHLEQQGRKHIHPNYTFHKDDLPFIIRLAAYFLNDEEKCKELDIDLNKGILLTGPIGIGKTTWFRLMQNITVKEQKFYYTTCRDVSFEFIREGYNTIDKYSKGIPFDFPMKNICFDDLGTENNIKYFGNECNVMAEIILSRYDLFMNLDIKTHITTNLSASEIEKYYTERVRSRLRQMMNVLSVPADRKDKRS